MAATFLGTIVKFEEDGVWLSPIVNGSKLHSPTDMVKILQAYSTIQTNLMKIMEWNS